MKIDIIREYHDNGKLHTETSVVNGIFHGMYKSYWKNGILATEKTFKNGKVHGLIKSWCENGDRNYQYYRYNGFWHGLEQYWWMGVRDIIMKFKFTQGTGPAIEFKYKNRI